MRLLNAPPRDPHEPAGDPGDTMFSSEILAQASRSSSSSSLLTVALVFALTACAWNPPRGKTADEARALSIAGAVYGIEIVPQVTIHYAPPDCTTADGGPGYTTRKGRCVSGALAPWMPHVNVAGAPGMRLSGTPGFCTAVWEGYELSVGHAPNEVLEGEAEKIAECRRRLRAEGL